MRTALFVKAAKLLEEGKVNFLFEKNDRIFFEIPASNPVVEKHSVILQYEDFMFKHSCTCKQIAYHDDPTRMCSHKIAAFGWLIEREKQKHANKK